MDELVETLNRHKARLLSLPGCTGVAIGYKVVKGELIDRLAIVVFVEKKQKTVAPGYLVPAMFDGVPTDVVEKTLGFKKLAGTNQSPSIGASPFKLSETDPFARFQEVFSGISITPFDFPYYWGTLGCIIHTTGNANIPAGNYLLTNYHVLAYADSRNGEKYLGSEDIIQPGYVKDGDPVMAYLCGKYAFGAEDELNDCAIATIGYGRTWANEVPNHSGQPGQRILAGIAAAAPGDEVYKYGATTKSTRGIVRYIQYNPLREPFQNAIYIENYDGSMWVGTGDSGSVLIRYRDDFVLGLNFAADAETMLPPERHPELPERMPAYSAGYAYDIQSQMNNFGGTVTLAPNQ